MVSGDTADPTFSDEVLCDGSFGGVLLIKKLIFDCLSGINKEKSVAYKLTNVKQVSCFIESPIGFMHDDTMEKDGGYTTSKGI